MARSKTSDLKDTTAHLGFEAKLWLSADKLRNNMDAAEPSRARQTANGSPKGERGGANQYFLTQFASGVDLLSVKVRGDLLAVVLGGLLERFLRDGEHTASAAGAVVEQAGAGLDLVRHGQEHEAGHELHRIAWRPMMFKDDAQLFKQFQDNESFRHWLTDTVFGMTYEE